MRNLVVIAFIAVSAFAEDVRITFLPPPIEGTLSAGIYSIDGKLVRVLASEATDDAFTAGLNGFITSWDGKDAAGTPLAAGKYFVRGFGVGDIEVEGVAFHGNEWLEEDEVPRLRDLRAVRLDGRELLISADSAGEGSGKLRLDLDTRKARFEVDSPLDAHSAVSSPILAEGRGGTTWSIETIEGDGVARCFVVQRRGNEVLRQLAVAATEPQPFAVAAATDRDELFLLERNASEVRLRALRLKETKSEADGKLVSEWEVFLSKSIAAQETFAQAAAALGRTQPPIGEERVRVAVLPNELLQVAPASVQVSVGIDVQGSFLRTLDGLPLRRLTTTPHLVWAALAREPDGAVTLFQSDGAVVEEYCLRQLEQMMAFDAGEYEWTGAK